MRSIVRSHIQYLYSTADQYYFLWQPLNDFEMTYE
jgi:hypothetical protein